MIRFAAHFDGQNVCPDEPVKLPTDQKLWVTVEPDEKPDKPEPLNLGEWFDRIEKEVGLIEGPEDWSAEHDHYLYGTPKRRGEDRRES